MTRSSRILFIFLFSGVGGVGRIAHAADTVANPGTPGAKVETEAFTAVRQELESKLANKQITPEQYSRHLTKLNQLMTQHQVDLQQGKGALITSQKEMYNDMLSQIHNEVQRTPTVQPSNVATPPAAPVASTSTPAIPQISSGPVPAVPAISSGIAAPGSPQ